MPRLRCIGAAQDRPRSEAEEKKKQSEKLSMDLAEATKVVADRKVAVQNEIEGAEPALKKARDAVSQAPAAHYRRLKAQGKLCAYSVPKSLRRRFKRPEA